jgi:antitoxin MazE
MELSVINIGNSKGIRLSKTILEKYDIQEKIELVLEQGYMILKPKVEPRKNWSKAFEKMHKNGDDQLLMNDVFEDENFDEWSK